MPENKAVNVVNINPLKEASINAYKRPKRLGNDNPSEQFRSALKYSREFRNNRWSC